jgi:bacillithiol system protein YtxJ
MNQATRTVVDDILDSTGFIYKHSNTCPISAGAQEEVLAFEEEYDVDVAKIVVQTQRDLSNYVEAETGIRHESPQFFIVRDGDVIWHASHDDITAEALAENIK